MIVADSLVYSQSFLYDYDPFRYHVKHTGTTPALTFFDSSVEKLMDENLGAVASFFCSLGRPVDEIGRPVMDALLRQPQLVLRQLHLPVKVKSHKSRKDDPRQLYLKIWLMRTTKQRDGEGTLLYQFHHPCNFSGGWGRRDQSLYQVSYLSVDSSQLLKLNKLEWCLLGYYGTRCESTLGYSETQPPPTLLRVEIWRSSFDCWCSERYRIVSPRWERDQVR